MNQLPDFIRQNYEIHQWRHALAVLSSDFPSEFEQIIDVLTRFRLLKSNLVKGGGRKSEIAGWIDKQFYHYDWMEKNFDVSIQIDEERHHSPTHSIDCYKNKIGLEIEWNNKDPFYDRDLNNFRLLFELRAISVGVIITRSDELQEIFNEIGRKDSFGASTTHMSKLLPRIEGGGGGGCPLLVFGITRNLYVEDC